MSYATVMRAVAVAPAILVACSPPPVGPLPVYEPTSSELFDTPWPTDARLRSDGTPDLAGFPNPAGLGLLARYVAQVESQSGWGNNGAVYVRFEGPLDRALLPSPEASVLPGSALVLLDVDPASPHRGERFPVHWRFVEEETRYQPGNLLATAPLPGFPLRPATTYALVVTADVAARHAGFQEDLRTERHLAPLGEALAAHGLDLRDVAVATVFTTADPLDETDRLARFVIDDVRTFAPEPELVAVGAEAEFDVWETDLVAPLLQHGERPYRTTGGGFVFEAHGRPAVFAWETLRLAVTTPKDLGRAPPTGWPVVLHAHGTGGDYLSLARNTTSFGIAAQIATSGMIGIGFDQPLHGTRATEDTDPELHSFNSANPEAARANFRQGALDLLYLTRALTRDPVTLRTPDGTTILLDPRQIAIVGHSHGGITAALALPWLASYARDVVISGAGGLMAITIVERKDPVDIAQALAELLEISGGEILDELHPVVSLLQATIDVTDPINYAPSWFVERSPSARGTPANVLVTSGIADVQTPYRTAEALAAAGRVPILAPAVTHPASLRLRGLPPVPGPVRGNVPTWSGDRVTAALAQWEHGDHQVLFRFRSASDLVRDFLRSSADGDATLAWPDRR